MIVTENQLDEWVRGNSRQAQGVIVELVWRLVAASSPQPKERRFPLGDSIGQHGADGYLDVDFGSEPFVPEGRSFWEIGTGVKAREKATADYNSLTKAVPEAVRCEATFVFVTPLSGRRDWEDTWKEDAQRTWLDTRIAKHEWRGVRLIDGTKVVDWIRQFPAVGVWLGEMMNGEAARHLETPEQRWNLIRAIGEPPLLTPKLFLSGREEACDKIKDVITGTVLQVKLETHYPEQVVAFVSAYLADLSDEERADVMGRWLIVSDATTWKTIATQQAKQTLIADSGLDLSGETGTNLIQMARRSRHAVIFGGTAGGIPDPSSVPLRSPRLIQIQEALEEAGYAEERARTLAQKSGGNLGSLLRCLQNVSVIPEWAEGSVASELIIAQLLGSWTEKKDGDRQIVEGLAGKGYGEWIGKMREMVLRPGAPLTQQDGTWKFVARYEGWFALGPKVFDDHLGGLQAAATTVLTERDPQFELPSEERYAAAIHGKVFLHSHQLRNGLAESLALIGSHPGALRSCTSGRAESIAALTVRSILAKADWERWASLNDVLPLLAEAAPAEFLRAVEQSLLSEPCPFDRVFAEEGDSSMSRTYMSGLLWALETLAWEPDHLGRVMLCLAELAMRDPGGRQENRPSNSLTTILLPWLPQTCATLETRRAALSALLSELPDVGWGLLVSLLPRSHSISFGTRRPVWRKTIPDDWPRHVTDREYRKQVALYSEMLIDAGKTDCDKLAEVIDHVEHLPKKAYEQLLTYLDSDYVKRMPEVDKLKLWTKLVDIVTKHRKYSDAEWAMKSAQIDRVALIAEGLKPEAPPLRHKRLFSGNDFDLYEEQGGYEDQRNRLDINRQEAVKEIATKGGLDALLTFAAEVHSSWQVGIAFGAVASADDDARILPGLLDNAKEKLSQFMAGFVWSRYYNEGWEWVDGMVTTNWTSEQIGQWLALLPFIPGVWSRTQGFLGSDDASYWIKARVNPYDADDGLEVAVDKLIQHDRPIAALRCIKKMLDDDRPFDVELCILALRAALDSSESIHSMDAHQTVDIIKALQSEPQANDEELIKLEWAYLPLLGRNRDASPMVLENTLANDPMFFSQVVRLAFRSKDEVEARDDQTEEDEPMAANAYRLLSDWKSPPGCNIDGTYDGQALVGWLKAMKKECAETGHLEVAMTMLGHSFVHAPPDPDGLWIHGAVADALNMRDAGDMREGFRTELYNSRGAHWVDPSGASERELAAQYREKAEAVENAGYPRLASTLRELAESYEFEARSAGKFELS